MPHQPSVLIVARDAIAARRVVTELWQQPLKEAARVRVANSSQFINSAMKAKQPPEDNEIWFGPDAHLLPADRLANIVEAAQQHGLTIRQHTEHPAYGDWWVRTDVPLRIWMAGDMRQARAVARVDWHMPASIEKRVKIVDSAERIMGVKGEGEVVWLMPEVMRRTLPSGRRLFDELAMVAYHRGFAIRNYDEHPMCFEPRHDIHRLMRGDK